MFKTPGQPFLFHFVYGKIFQLPLRKFVAQTLRAINRRSHHPGIKTNPPNIWVNNVKLCLYVCLYYSQCIVQDRFLTYCTQSPELKLQLRPSQQN